MKQLNRSIVFVSTNCKSERIAVLKEKISLSKLDDEDTNVFQKSLIDRYMHRPQELQSICLAEFAATYVTKYELTAWVPTTHSALFTALCLRGYCGLAVLATVFWGKEYWAEPAALLHSRG